MSSLDPQLIISASETFMNGVSNSAGLQTILNYLDQMDVKTQTTVLQNIRRGLEFSALYNDTEIMKHLLRYLIPQVNQYTKEMMSNPGNIPSNLSTARSLADDIVYLNRYESFREMLLKNQDKQLNQLFAQTKSAIDNMNSSLKLLIRQANNYVSISTRFYNFISNLNTQAKQFGNNFKAYMSAGAASITSGATYLTTIVTTSYELGIACAIGAYVLAGAVGIGLGFGIHYSGIGKYIGTDYAGEKVGDLAFDLFNH